jgi:hypothetical protein
VGAHKGHLLDAAVTSELLVSLFIPEGINKLHDGAVIIRNYRIAKAGVFFPMPEARVLDESFGSRHRAALGITEETDAVVVIVSEERGTISFCFNGNIASNLDGPKLRTMLEAIFSPKIRKKKRKVGAKAPAAEAEPVSERVLTKTIPPSEKTPKPLKPIEPESGASAGPRSSRSDEETLPLRPRPQPKEEAPSSRDSEPPPAPLRPRVLLESESGAASAGAARGSTPPPPLRTPAGGQALIEMPRSPITLGSSSEDVAGDEQPEKDDPDTERKPS